MTMLPCKIGGISQCSLYEWAELLVDLQMKMNRGAFPLGDCFCIRKFSANIHKEDPLLNPIGA